MPFTSSLHYPVLRMAVEQLVFTYQFQLIPDGKLPINIGYKYKDIPVLISQVMMFAQLSESKHEQITVVCTRRREQNETGQNINGLFTDTVHDSVNINTADISEFRLQRISKSDHNTYMP